MKRTAIALLTVLMVASLALVGCGGPTGGVEPGPAPAETPGTEKPEATYTIGVNQFAEHGSLDNCVDGMLEGLAAEGIVEGQNLTVIRENANADMGTATQIAQAFATQKVDLMVGIATPSAQASYNVAKDANIPVVYNAITDPVAADLANADGTNPGEITGVSDALPVEAQLKMIREIMPDAKTIGILYTTSEVNSISSIEKYQELAPKYGFTIETVGVNVLADVAGAADVILPKVDALTNLTDNTVVSALPTVLDKAFAAGKPVFGSEIEQVRIGCLASEGIDYINLGKQVGTMAAQILKGEKKASEIPFETLKESSLYLNSEAAQKLGITFDNATQNRAVENFAKIEAS